MEFVDMISLLPMLSAHSCSLHHFWTDIFQKSVIFICPDKRFRISLGRQITKKVQKEAAFLCPYNPFLLVWAEKCIKEPSAL